MNSRNLEKAERKKQKLDLARDRLEEEKKQAAHARSMELDTAAHARSMELRRVELDEQRMALDRQRADEEKQRWAFIMNNQKKE